MPLILTPILWRKFSDIYYFNYKRKKRKQDDNIYLDKDYLDSFENILWRSYKNKFVKNFEKNIKKLKYSRNDKYENYISKNNNNLSRIDYILNNIENSKVIIPIRDPIQTCISSTNVDLIFTKNINENPYIFYELKFLTHYEFSKLKKYSDILTKEQIEIIKNKKSKSLFNGYLFEWYFIHKHILNELMHKKNVMIFPYEKTSNKDSIKLLFEFIKIPVKDIDTILNKANYEYSSKKEIRFNYEDEILQKCKNLYKDLTNDF